MMTEKKIVPILKNAFNPLTDEIMVYYINEYMYSEFLSMLQNDINSLTQNVPDVEMYRLQFSSSRLEP